MKSHSPASKSESSESPTPVERQSVDGATPRPWAAHPQMPRLIVSAEDAQKALGGSIDEVRDKARYAVLIAEASYNALTTFEHKPTKERAEANANLIVTAVNNHAHVAALVEAAEAILENSGVRTHVALRAALVPFSEVK